MTRTFKIGIFDDEEKFLSSIKSLQEKNFLIYDVFTPYPVHEVFHLLKRKSRIADSSLFLRIVWNYFNTGISLLYLRYRLADCLWRKTIQFLPFIYCCYYSVDHLYCHNCKPCCSFQPGQSFFRAVIIQFLTREQRMISLLLLWIHKCQIYLQLREQVIS